MTDKNEFEVIFFKKDDNTIPVKEFLDVLDIKMRAKAVGMIIRLEKYGNELRDTKWWKQNEKKMKIVWKMYIKGFEWNKENTYNF